jgi:hypothetical protein
MIKWSIANVLDQERCWETLDTSSGSPRTASELMELGWDRHPVHQHLWRRMDPKLAAIIRSSESVRIQELSRRTLTEWGYRLHMLFDLGRPFLESMGPDGPVPIRLLRRDLVPFLGLRCGCKEWTNEQFDSYVRAKWLLMDPIPELEDAPPTV